MGHHFEKYCKDYENIENYEAAKKDNFIGWECHHRRGANITQKELISLGQYYNISSDELVFLTTAEHNQLHHIGRHHTEEIKKRIGEASKGRRHTEEARKKMSDAAKGKHLSEESKKKIAEALKGKHLGKDNPFYGKTHSDELKKKLSEINKVRMKGMCFFNNGKINIRAKECPPGFVPGRIKKL